MVDIQDYYEKLLCSTWLWQVCSIRVHFALFRVERWSLSYMRYRSLCTLSTSFHNMLLDQVQYNNMFTHEDIKSTSILKEYIQPCICLLQTVKAYAWIIWNLFWEKLGKCVLVCYKTFAKKFVTFAKLKLFKKEEKYIQFGHSKQAANVLFCTSRVTEAALVSKEVDRNSSM